MEEDTLSLLQKIEKVIKEAENKLLTTASDIARKHEKQFELPSLKVELLREQFYQPSSVVLIAQVSDATNNGFSHRKKQCDLWEHLWGSARLLSEVLKTIDFSSSSSRENALNVLEIGGGKNYC